MTAQPDLVPTANLAIRRVARPSSSYSRFVSAMKLLLPAVAVGLVMLVAVWPRLQAAFQSINFKASRLDLREALDLRMVNVHYAGIDKRRRPFVLTADVARQSPQHQELVSLEGPKADITLKSEVWLYISGDTGVYLSPTQLLDLFGNVKLFHDRGYELTTDTAHLDMTAGTAEGHDPVQGQGVFGDVESEGFRLLDHGEIIIFTGHAKLHLTPRPTLDGGGTAGAVPERTDAERTDAERTDAERTDAERTDAEAAQ
jgi:lipopolysaccharide export system protein LptC